MTLPTARDGMLQWLADRPDYGGIAMHSWPADIRPGMPEWVWSVTMHYRKPDPRLNITAHGKTLDEGLYRLIEDIMLEDSNP